MLELVDTELLTDIIIMLEKSHVMPVVTDYII